MHKINFIFICVIAILLNSCNLGKNNLKTDNKNVNNALIVKSIKNWAKCDGITDDAIALSNAINSAKNDAFILQIDCPIFFHIGMDIERPIFIDNGTSINFSESGLILVDNIFVPAFVIANSSNILLSNWKLKYIGRVPIDYRVGGYYYNGVWVNVQDSDNKALQWQLLLD